MVTKLFALNVKKLIISLVRAVIEQGGVKGGVGVSQTVHWKTTCQFFTSFFFFCVVTVLNIPTWFLFLSFVTHDLCVCVCMWSVVWNADGTKPRFTYRVWRTRHCCIFLVICSVPFGRYGFCKGRLGSPLGEKPSFIVCAYAKSVFVFTRPWWCGRGVVVWLAY